MRIEPPLLQQSPGRITLNGHSRRIDRQRHDATLVAPYEGGWLETGPKAVADFAMGKGVEPDRPPSEAYESYPGVYVPPFHYKNPVSGR